MIRLLLVGAGTLCVGLGVAGVVIPGLPTTPFLLLAAACYARSSPRFHAWLLNHRWFGGPIRDFREKGGMRRERKVSAVVTLWATLGLTGFLTKPAGWGIAGLIAVGIGVTGWLLRVKTLPDLEDPPSSGRFQA